MTFLLAPNLVARVWNDFVPYYESLGQSVPSANPEWMEIDITDTPPTHVLVHSLNFRTVQRRLVDWVDAFGYRIVNSLVTGTALRWEIERTSGGLTLVLQAIQTGKGDGEIRLFVSDESWLAELVTTLSRAIR